MRRLQGAPLQHSSVPGQPGQAYSQKMGSQQLTVYKEVSVRPPACPQGSSGMALSAPSQVASMQGPLMQRMPLQDSDTAQGGQMAAGASAGQEADLDPLDPRFLARIHDPHQR